jgi:hypothetical protein
MRRLVLVIGLLAWFAPRTFADTIAMLPLDGEKRLEIYGQPVAAEIARALKAAGLDVVVVGAKMDVPDNVQLIVDGTIKTDKKKQITLSIRVRDPRDGTTLETLPEAPTALDNLDKAAADLSSRVVPSVKAQLDALAKAAAAAKQAAETKPVTEPVVHAVTAVAEQPALSVIASAARTSPQHVLLKTALEHEAPAWAKGEPYAATVSLEVLGYSVEKGKVPFAHGRVHVLISSGARRFDRVVVTDTIVGDAGIAPEQLAERTAREVLAIVRPNLRRTLAQ